MSNKEDVMLRYQKMVEVLRKNPGKYVFLIAQVDPDALGSTVALKELLEYVTSEFEDVGDAKWSFSCCYAGGIGHPQNRCIFTKYNLGTSIRLLEESLPLIISSHANEVKYILVDSSDMLDQRLPEFLREERPLIIVDHHRGSTLEDGEDVMYWIEDLGSASTMVFELMHEGANFFDDILRNRPERREQLADLLALGIYIDTHDMRTGSRRDLAAFNLLGEWRSNIHVATDYPLPPSYFANLRTALETMRREDHILVANLGVIESRCADDIAVISDELIRMEGVSLVLTWAVVDGKVRISARGTNLSNPLDEWLASRFGERSGAKITPTGKGEGGALLDVGMDFWVTADTTNELVSLVGKRICSLAFGSD